jgi:RNA polymerase sigma-70 factor (ECF subfamily)
MPLAGRPLRRVSGVTSRRRETVPVNDVDEAEARLVDAAVAGDRAAFGALYDRHLARVYRHVLYRVGRAADAEDLTQHVFLQAWRAIKEYRRTGAPFVAWLLAIAGNAAAGFHRARRPEQTLEFDPQNEARWADPEREALARYDRAAVRRAILRLRPDQRDVTILRFVEGFDHAAVAAALGKSPAHVRVIQHRALLELRRLLSHQVAV